jgi:succinate-semialdehyde dehydrogenase/glutarate-semialdehyde dehydrogenase
MNTYRTINPFDQSVLAEYEWMTTAELDTALQKSASAYSHWKKTSLTQRVDLLLALAKQLHEKKESLVVLMANEMGKVLREGRIEIDKCITCCHYYSENTIDILSPQIVSTEAHKSFIIPEPTGAVLGIMPWNFPVWQVIRAAVPTIMAGNVFLLKHAPNVWQCAQELENLFLQAGFPAGVFQNLKVEISETEKIISHPVVQGVTLTGSEMAGASVAALAGKHIKKSVLELGGSDPLIVMEDADLDRAAQVALQSRMQNAGQSCIASKRFIVLKKIHDEFANLLLEKAKKLKQGSPLDDAVTTGPMARIDLAEDLEAQQNASMKNGTELLLGAMRNGCNYQPTILDSVRPGIPAFDEEMFGPVACIIAANDEEHAITLANQNRYGLGASIWSRDLLHAEKMASKIESGSVYVNHLMRSDVRLPFGGIKKSGFGRELGKAGMLEFTNMKTVFISE